MEVSAGFVSDSGGTVWIIPPKVCISAHTAKIIPFRFMEVKSKSVFVHTRQCPLSLSHHREPNQMRQFSEPRIINPKIPFENGIR